MWYWYLTCKDLRLTDSLKTEKLAMYEKMTGIQRSSAEDLKTAFEFKNAVLNECPAALVAMTEDRDKQLNRKKIWRTVSAFGIPVSFGLGVVGTVYLISR